MFLLGLITGGIGGAFVATFVMALMTAASDADDRTEYLLGVEPEEDFDRLRLYTRD